MSSRHADYFTKPVTTNMLLDEFVKGINPVSSHFPVRGFVSAGGENWSAQFGRDTLGWGDGISGNLIIGDHLDYHEFLRFTTNGSRFKFTAVVSSFIHPATYFSDMDDYLSGGPVIGKYNEPIEGFRALIGHRLEFRPWDSLKITLSKTMMYMGDSFDFRFLNPGMLYHNYYMRSNSKSLVGLDIDYAISNGCNMYINTLIDDTGAYGNPSAFGILGGLKSSRSVGLGTAFFRIEGAYTDPYLYLRDGDEHEFSTDYIVSIWQWGEYFPASNGTKSGLYEVQRFLGYRYGCDLIAFQAEAGYKRFGSWSVQAGVLYLLQGIRGMYTAWNSDDSESSAPTESHPNDPKNRDSVQKTLLLELTGTYTPARNIDLFAHACYQHVWNIDNIRANGSDFDLQFSFGVSYKL